MVRDAGSIAGKQVRRAVAATDDFSAGVSAPEKNPIAAAIAKNDKRIAKLQESIKNRTWETAMGKITQDDWQRKTAGLGARRYAEGVQENADKVNKFWTGWQPKLQAAQTAVNAMPDATDANREAKMVENVRKLKAAKGTWR